MITINATGFITRKPELVLVGKNSRRKCEFTVSDTRRAWINGEWTDVWEYVTFVAWDDEAERIALLFDRGSTVTCVGEQETSRWTDAQQAKHSVTKFSLLSWKFLPQRRTDQGAGERQQSSQQGGAQQSNQDRRPVPATGPGESSNGDDMYRDGDGGYPPDYHR